MQRLILVLGFLFAVMVFYPIAAFPVSHGQDLNCDTVVTDDANVFGSGLASVQTEVQSLIALGADVRVRTVEDAGSSNDALDKVAKNYADNCPSWKATDGGFKNGLIVFMIGVKDRHVGIYYGDQWKKTLDPKRSNIEDKMKPFFRDGNFSGGFVTGIKATNALVNAQLNPPPPGVSGSGGTTNNVDFGSIGKWFFWIFIILLIIVGLGVLVFFVYKWWQDREARRGAQMRAKTTKNSCGDKLTTISAGMGKLEVLVASVQSQVSALDSKELGARFDKLTSLLARAQSQFNSLENTANPENSLTVAEYESIEQSYSGISSNADDVVSAFNSTQNELNRLQEVISQAPKKVEEIGSLISTTQSSVEKVKSLGFKVNSLDREVNQVLAKVPVATVVLQEKRFGDASKIIDDAKAILEQVSKQALDLPRVKERLEAAVKSLVERIASTQELIINGRAVFGQIEENYSSDSYNSVTGNGTESEKRVHTAQLCLENAQKCILMDNQNWEGAQAQIDQAGIALDQAESYMHSIVALKEHLDQAKANAGTEIASAEADVQAALKYAQTHASDIYTSHKSEIAKATGLIAQAKVELAKDLPEYLSVVEWASTANEIADKVLDSQRDEVAKAERARAKAAQALRSAQAAISQAEEFIQDHEDDVDSDAKRKLRDAKQRLSQSSSNIDGLSMANLLILIKIATDAQQLAAGSYSSAESDFRAAEDRREAAERRSSNWSGSSGRSGGSSSWGGGGGMFGGGSSFGGGGGFSGGSSSFGGGGGMSGGSSSW